MATDDLESIKYIKNSPDVDDAYGNKDNVRDAKDINFDLKNSIKNKLYITVPSNMNGVDYANYIVKNSSNIETDIIPYSNDMTIAEKLLLLQQMKDRVREHIIKNLKNNKRTDFYDNDGNEKIPFVAYWKWIEPLEKPTYLKLKASASTISWVKRPTITATLYDNTDTVIKNSNLTLTNRNYTKTAQATNGSYTFTVPSVSGPTTETYNVSYAGTTGKYVKCSNSIKITFIKDTPTLKSVTSNSIYEGYHAKYKLLNSQGDPIANETVLIKIGSNDWVEKKTNSQGIVSVAITKSVKVYYKFNGTSKYNSVAQKTQSFTIKPNETKSKCSGTMTQKPTSRTSPYQIWSDISSDCTKSNYLRCGHESTGYSNKNTLGSSNGSYYQPAVLSKTLDLNVPSDAKIKSVHVKWAEKQTNGPSSSTSTTSFINIKKVTISTSGAISYSKTIDTKSGGKTYGGSWVSHDLNLGTNFTPSKNVTLTMKYGPNESTNTGTIYVQGPQIIVEYVPAE